MVGNRLVLPGLAILSALGVAAALATPQDTDLTEGQDIYEYFCYQCHGYAGDGKTLTGAYVAPRPRDFTSIEPDQLSRESMIRTITQGREGTVMVSFSSVLTPAQIESVVDYIRDEYLGKPGSQRRYHSKANGWEDHDRYQAAYPFISGELQADDEPSGLTPEQIHGRDLFLNSCISCHDQPLFLPEEELRWESVPTGGAAAPAEAE